MPPTEKEPAMPGTTVLTAEEKVSPDAIPYRKADEYMNRNIALERDLAAERDRIRALEADLAAVRNQVVGWKTNFRDVVAERDAAREELRICNRQVERWQHAGHSGCAAAPDGTLICVASTPGDFARARHLALDLAAQLAAVREALRPFAAIEVPHEASDGTWVATTRFCGNQVTAHSVRRARAVLGGEISGAVDGSGRAVSPARVGTTENVPKGATGLAVVVAERDRLAAQLARVRALAEVREPSRLRADILTALDGDASKRGEE